MKKVTGIMVTLRDIGTVLSCTFSEIDEATGEIKSGNNTRSKLLLSKEEKKAATALFDIAGEMIGGDHA